MEPVQRFQDWKGEKLPEENLSEKEATSPRLRELIHFVFDQVFFLALTQYDANEQEEKSRSGSEPYRQFLLCTNLPPPPNLSAVYFM